MEARSEKDLPEVGNIIRDRENPDDTYRVDKVAGGMVTYSSPFADGEIRTDAFPKHFEIIQGVAKLKVRAEGVDCPHCDSWIDGFINDPRGSVQECESCGESFKIDSEVELT